MRKNESSNTKGMKIEPGVRFTGQRKPTSTQKPQSALQNTSKPNMSIISASLYAVYDVD